MVNNTKRTITVHEAKVEDHSQEIFIAYACHPAGSHGRRGPAAAKSKAEMEVEFAGKVKAGIAKLGTGSETRVKIKLRNKTKLEGSSAMTGKRALSHGCYEGAANRVAYTPLKRQGQQSFNGEWTTIGRS